MRAQAQVARMSRELADRDHALAQVMQACDRAGRLIDQLLALSRLEGQQAVQAQGACELVGLVRDLMAEMASNQTHNWILEGLECVMVQVDPNLCRIVLRNLLDNAQRYSPPGATIAVQIVRLGHSVRMVIADGGPGLLPEHQARLGERFFRVNDSQAPGSGLGWSIVRRIAENQHLDVSLGRSAQWGGMEVTLDFPVATE
jgi:two-component system sensor histidine kinase QseC